MKGHICEAFGWTFREFDEQPADEVFRYWQLKGLFDRFVRDRARAGQGDDE